MSKYNTNVHDDSRWIETLLLMAERQPQVLCVLNLKEMQQWLLGKQLRGCRWWWGGGGGGGPSQDAYPAPIRWRY